VFCFCVFDIFLLKMINIVLSSFLLLLTYGSEGEEMEWPLTARLVSVLPIVV
jgi:hypothetical protein